MSKKGQTPARAARSRSRAKYFISGEINTKLREHGRRCRRSSTRIAAQLQRRRSQYTLDGISVEYPDWHFNVRPSNTEPLLRLNLEATTPELMEQKRDEVLALIRA